MELLIARVLDGATSGVVYGFIGLALVVVFRGSGYLNFAQGEMAMFAAYVAWALHAGGLPMWLAVVLATLAAFVSGLAVERALIRPLGRNAEYQVVIVTIGLFLAINAGAAAIWSSDPLNMPALVPAGPNDFLSVLGKRVQFEELLMFGALLVALAVLYGMFRYTRLGLAMRVATSNPESAVLMGIRVTRVNALGWAIAAAVGGLAAILVAPSTSLTPTFMFTFLIYGAAAAMLGGFDSPGGAVFAGIVLGVGENLVASYVDLVGSDLKQGFALVVILAVLMLRPSGLFGSKQIERV
jgi:branched-chain amino acid transport system permease protein